VKAEPIRSTPMPKPLTWHFSQPV